MASSLWRSRWLVGKCSCCGSRFLSRPLSDTPRKIVLLSKTTRLEFQTQKKCNGNLKNWHTYVGSAEYKKLQLHHDYHYKSVDEIETYLRSLGVEVRLRNGANYCTEDVDWADFIFSAGGDGTFLFASSKVFSPDKLVVGFNTDKITSEGFLCFNSGGRYPSLQDSLQAVFQRDVPLYRRARIRVEKNGKILPVRALNEVFVGEVNPSHASYYELHIDGSVMERQKSSGLLIYTSTGSTSWAYNVNSVREEEVENILRLYEQRTGDSRFQDTNTVCKLVADITAAYNRSVASPGNYPGLSYVVREPIKHGIFQAQHLKGTALSIAVKSLTLDSRLIVDGNYSCDMEGHIANCLIHPEDNLTTLYHSQ